MPNKRIVIMKAITGLWEAFPSDDSRGKSSDGSDSGRGSGDGTGTGSCRSSF